MQNLQALLIGIDRYGPSPIVSDLHGAVADLDAVRELLRRCQVPRQSLRCLVSSHDEARNRPSRMPTYERMVGAIRDLGERARKARAEALIYYSGHGGQTDTLIPGAKGCDGKDEGLVPWNLHQTGARLLHDVELTYLLTEMAQSGVPVTLVVDACHSGGVLRKGSLGVRPKRIKGAFPGTGGGGSQVATEAALEQVWQRVHYRSQKPIRHSRRQLSGWASKGLLQLPMVGVLAACRQTEVAYERDFGVGPRGVFTQYLLEALTRGAAPGSWDALQRWMARQMRRLPRAQSPVFEGSSSPSLFARFLDARDRPIEVLEVDPESQRILLDVGAAFGVGRGARLEVKTAAGRGPRVGARVEDAAADEAWAVVERPESREQNECTEVEIRPGDEAVLVAASGSGLRVAVRSAVEMPRPRRVLRNGRRIRAPGPDEPGWGAQLQEQARSRSEGWLEWVPADGEGPPPEVVVTRETDRYCLLDGGGERLPRVPEIPSAGTRSIRRLVDLLLHLARFFRVRDLANRDERSKLAGLVEAELGLLPRGWQPGDPMAVEEEPVERVSAGRWILLEVTNRSLQALHLFVLDLRPDWSVEVIHPNRGLETLEGGHKIALPFETFLPSGHAGGIETLKVLATTAPNRPRALCLPALEVPTDRAVRGLGSPVGGIWRNAGFRRAHDCWTTAEVDFEVVPRRGYR